MRVYLPMRTGELASLRDGDQEATLPLRGAYGVTAAARALDPTADEEDLEFDAMCAALDAAAELPGDGRRVVAAADVTPPPDEGSTDAPVAVGAIALRDVVSFHLEETPGRAGERYDALLWYDVTEVDQLIGV